MVGTRGDRNKVKRTLFDIKLQVDQYFNSDSNTNVR